MKIGILGTGDVGRALGKALITLGHDVKMGSRSATNEKALAWAKEMGQKASAGTFADAAVFGDIIVLATLGVANESVLKSAGPERFRDKLVIDTTNPLDFSGGMPPKLAVSGTDSAGERVQRLLPDARVVKAFNTVGSPFMFGPTSRRPTRHVIAARTKGEEMVPRFSPTSAGADRVGGLGRSRFSKRFASSGSSRFEDNTESAFRCSGMSVVASRGVRWEPRGGSGRSARGVNRPESGPTFLTLPYDLDTVAGCAPLSGVTLSAGPPQSSKKGFEIL